MQLLTLLAKVLVYMPWAYVLTEALGVDITHKKIVTTTHPHYTKISSLRNGR
jgi:hypothetical protein